MIGTIMNTHAIFISHASEDRERAKELAQDWLNDIEEGLDNAGVVIVLGAPPGNC
jgi:hypothetical protein